MSVPSLADVRAHLERVAPTRVREALQVWVAPQKANLGDDAVWLLLGELDEVCTAHPYAAERLRSLIPSRSRGFIVTLALAPDVRVICSLVRAEVPA